MPQSRVFSLAILLAILVIIAGCGSTRQRPAASGKVNDIPFAYFNGDYVNTETMRTSPPNSVAILPFTMEEEDETATEPTRIVRLGMYRHFAALPYEDMELHEVDHRLQSAGLSSQQALMHLLDNAPQKLKRILKVDAVITGTVTHFDRAFAGLVSQVSVGCTARMIRLSDGALLWEATHVSRDFGGGVSVSPIGLVTGAFSSLWNLRDEQLLRGTDDLFREMTATIAVPDSPLRVRGTPPRIELFAIPGPKRIYNEAEGVPLRLVGEAGASAFAVVDGIEGTIPLYPVSEDERAAIRAQLLAEVRDSAPQNGAHSPQLLAATLAHIDSLEIYEGTWIPEYGMDKRAVTVRGHLLGNTGAESVAVAAKRPRIDTTLPAAPTGLQATPLSGGAIVEWNPVASADVESYDVLISEMGQTGFRTLISTHDVKATLRGLPNFSAIFLRVRAKDSAGNPSILSRPVKVTPAPRPDIVPAAVKRADIGGDIGRIIFLPAEVGPYTVSSTLTVSEGAELHIGPGAVLRFMPETGLYVTGGSLFCHGTADRPIWFIPASQTASAGSWTGVSITDSPATSAAHLTISKAATGLSIKNAAPHISGLTVDSCSQAGIHLLHGARPDISCSVITDNLGMGGIVMEGNDLAPRISDTVFDANSPFAVQSFSPKLIDLSGNHFTAENPGNHILGNISYLPALPKRPAHCPSRQGAKEAHHDATR